MKKILLAAVAALAIVGCTQNEEIEKAGEKAEVNFGTVVSKTTRAAVTDLDILKQTDVGFTVYAYNTGDKDMDKVTAAGELVSFMSNVKATFDSQWNVTGGPYYWPLNAKVQFFAYANPGTGTLVYNAPVDSQVYPTVTYTVADVSSQTDFVVAKATNKTKDDASVLLTFAHALTQVNFSVKGADQYTYKITSITLKGVANKGTYNFGAVDDEWGDVSGTVNYLYSLKSDPSVTGTEAISIGAANAALMLMPQTMPTEADKTTIEVIYQVYNGNTAITDAVTSSIDLKGTTGWTAGKKIRYTLKLTNQGASVSFDAAVGPWGESETDPLNPVTPPVE